MERRLMVQFVGLLVLTMLFAVLGPAAGSVSAANSPVGPLRAGTDGVIYDAANRPVRLVGFNWTGTENGGRSDFLKSADVCGVSWRIPSDRIGGLPFDYDNMYQVIRDSGYNVIRIPVSWNNLEPIAPVWDVGSSSYRHSWNVTYLEDLKSMVSRARAVGLMVILDMHQDYWSPALHQITNWDGSRGYCEGVGMPRWLYPTIDAKESTTQNVDFYNGMNWFFRNIHDPLSTVTRETPWQLLYATWDFLAHQFSAESGFPDYQAVVAADLFNEPYFRYVGGNPPAGRSVLQAAGDRLRTFYEALAPAITTRNPSWLLLFQDCTGGYNIANPSLRETPTIPTRPAVAGNWVYSLHLYNFAYGTFSDGVPRHDDFGLTLADVAYAKAQEWGVPLLIGEFTNFN
ncbi:MAG: glycoside hydrolase family 5 protein, partial [Candidatus Nanopelagicales bacterium]|nr:glycoside hydrolase family 5 protein [Candidatus Nanopelagicales bacterium]